jgi:hypothetical protein
MRVCVRTRNSGRGLDRLGGMVVWCGGGAYGERRAPTLVDAPGCLYIQDRAIKKVSVLSHCSSLDLFRRTTERAYCVVQKTLEKDWKIVPFVEPLCYLYLLSGVN